MYDTRIPPPMATRVRTEAKPRLAGGLSSATSAGATVLAAPTPIPQRKRPVPSSKAPSEHAHISVPMRMGADVATRAALRPRRSDMGAHPRAPIVPPTTIMLTQAA